MRICISRAMERNWWIVPIGITWCSILLMFIVGYMWKKYLPGVGSEECLSWHRALFLVPIFAGEMAGSMPGLIIMAMAAICHFAIGTIIGIAVRRRMYQLLSLIAYATIFSLTALDALFIERVESALPFNKYASLLLACITPPFFLAFISCMIIARHRGQDHQKT